MLKLDNTKRSDYVSCLRKYDIKWHHHIHSYNNSTALRYGIGFHGCMEGFYKHIAEHGWGEVAQAMGMGSAKGMEEFNRDSEKFIYYPDYRTLENMGKSLIQYIDEFRHDEGFLKIIETEKVFEILITPTPMELKWFPGVEPFIYTGRLDLEVELSNMPWIVEFKTTGQPLSVQKSRLHRLTQVMGYIYAGRLVFSTPPEGSLMVLHHLSAYAKKKDGQKTGEYGSPKIQFERVPLIFTDDDLLSFRIGLLSDAWKLQLHSKSNFYPYRHYSCYTYGQCSYVDLCEQNLPVENCRLGDKYFIDSDPWHVAKDTDPKNIITLTEDNTKWLELQQKIYN